MCSVFPLCSFSFQLVEPMVGGPDVLSRLSTTSAVKWSRSLRLYYHHGPICQMQLLIWGCWPPAARWREAGHPRHTARGRLGPHLLWHLLAYLLACSFCMSAALPAALIIKRWYGNEDGVCSVCNGSGVNYSRYFSSKWSYPLDWSRREDNILTYNQEAASWPDGVISGWMRLIHTDVQRTHAQWISPKLDYDFLISLALILFFTTSRPLSFWVLADNQFERQFAWRPFKMNSVLRCSERTWLWMNL